MIELKDEPVFHSSFARIPEKRVSGTFYVYGEMVADKVRITKVKGDLTTIEGWINYAK